MDNLQPITLPGIDPHRPIVIAGPCSAESEEQTLETARKLHKNGVNIFRAGIWKPRTKPGGFEGIGAPGLLWLMKVKSETGMYVATEVATANHVKLALEAGVDLLWIGARTSANPFAMQELADVLKGHDVPVLVKNPVNPDLDLWIGAMQRIYNAGITRIGAIHRGFTAYGQHIYRNMPQWHIPMELKRIYPNLPLFCDPSHIGGKRELVGPLSQQAMDMGYDGLIIESHCNPDCALSDKNQQITPEILNILLNTLVVRETGYSTENLSLLRQQIDSIDHELIDLLAKRMRVSKEIGLYKKEHGVQVVQSSRYDDILKSRIKMGTDLDMSDEFMKSVFVAIHGESVRHQINIINNENKK